MRLFEPIKFLPRIILKLLILPINILHNSFKTINVLFPPPNDVNINDHMFPTVGRQFHTCACIYLLFNCGASIDMASLHTCHTRASTGTRGSPNTSVNSHAYCRILTLTTK